MSSFSSSPPPSLPLYKSPPPLQKPQPPPPMAGEGKWVTFTDDDSLSLIDLPIVPTAFQKNQTACNPSEGIKEFEFCTFGSGGSLVPESEMCAADEIFSKGQLLPSFRQSSVGSLSCRRSNSNSSHSSSSNSSNHGRVSVSNNFYAHPSPKPQLRTAAAPRRSTGSAPPGWALFRLGLVKTPEIELTDLRSRRMSKPGAKKMPVALFGFGCGCGQDAVQPIPIPMPMPMPVNHNGRQKKGGRLEKEEVMWSSRMSEWLEELSIGKRSVM